MIDASHLSMNRVLLSVLVDHMMMARVECDADWEAQTGMLVFEQDEKTFFTKSTTNPVTATVQCSDTVTTRTVRDPNQTKVTK
jgi:hypothetical protein